MDVKAEKGVKPLFLVAGVLSVCIAGVVGAAGTANRHARGTHWHPVTKGVAVNPKFAAEPPAVAAMSLQKLPARQSQGNAKLYVRFVDDRALPRQIAFQMGAQTIVLRHTPTVKSGPANATSPKVYTAILDVHFAEWQKFAQNLRVMAQAEAKDGDGTVPVFRWRRVVARVKPTVINASDFSRSRPVRIFPLTEACTTDPERTLLIRDVKVVEDKTRTFNPFETDPLKAGTPMGVWTFGHLMKEMCNQPVTGIDPAEFTLRWLKQWAEEQTINGDKVKARAKIESEVIQPWIAKSQMGGKLDLAKAPFKLLAIVNRIDLRENAAFGSDNAGEGRFVFGVMNAAGEPTQFTVIFEYGIKRHGCHAVKNWAQQWLDLGTLTLGSPAYNIALQAITDEFTKAGADPTKLPNKSSLNQIRTNERFIGDPWELREFRIAANGANPGWLLQTTVKQNPAWSLNNTPRLADYILANEADIIASPPRFTVPLQFPSGQNFLGGASPAEGPWQAPGINPSTRHLFALNTCNGCHTGETATSFTHVKPAGYTHQADLSDFMTGLNGSPFNDLERRCQDLQEVANEPCLLQLAFQPLRMVH